jgi:Acetyltransferase (GNAT) domain
MNPPFSHALDARRPRAAGRGAALAAPNVRRDLALLVRTEWVPLAALSGITDMWRTLATRALEPNVFYGPAFALPAANAFDPHVGALLVWSKASVRRLIGLWPVRVARRRYGVPLPVLAGWTHSYAPLGTPLVDRDQAELVIEALFDHVRADTTLPKLMLLPLLPEGPVADLIAAEVARRGGRMMDFDVHARAMLAPNNDQRALLTPGDERVDYLDRAIAPKKAKELRRQRRRLDDAGPVRLVVAREPAEIAAALSAFFELEAQGWKGRAGTAAVQHKDAWSFMQDALAALATNHDVRIDRLMRDDQTIAAGITLREGASSWFWKIAYDETQARFSPGVQLSLELTASLLADETVMRTDSCATADHPMIDHLWRERLTLSDRLIAPDAGALGSFAIGRQLEAMRRSAISGAKRLRGLVSG